MRFFVVYAVRRLLQFAFVIIVGISLAFLITHFSPVNPVEQSLSLMTNFGATDPRAVEILRQSLTELYGLQGNLFEQYIAFWGRIITGDFGPSLSAFPTPVIVLIRAALPWTLGLLDALDAVHLGCRQSPRRAGRVFPHEPRAQGGRHRGHVAPAGAALHHRPDRADPVRLSVAVLSDQRRFADEPAAVLQLGVHFERPRSMAPCRRCRWSWSASADGSSGCGRWSRTSSPTTTSSTPNSPGSRRARSSASTWRATRSCRR